MPTYAEATLPLGSPAPEFRLPDVTTGDWITLADFEGKQALVVTFICRHCPYVKHVQEVLAKIGHEYPSRGVAVVAIGSNDAVRYPDDAPESLREYAKEAGFVFPFLYDESQDVARAYTAACTPDTFVFDADRKLVYRGQLDSTRPRSGDTATGADLIAVLEALLAGTPVPVEQKPSVGCGIKWKE